MSGAGMKPLDFLGDLVISGTDLTIKSPLAGENLSRVNFREVKIDGNETFRAPHLTGLFHHRSERQCGIWRLRGGLWLSWGFLFGLGSFFFGKHSEQRKDVVT